MSASLQNTLYFSGLHIRYSRQNKLRNELTKFVQIWLCCPRVRCHSSPTASPAEWQHSWRSVGKHVLCLHWGSTSLVPAEVLAGSCCLPGTARLLKKSLHQHILQEVLGGKQKEGSRRGGKFWLLYWNEYMQTFLMITSFELWPAIIKDPLAEGLCFRRSEECFSADTLPSMVCTAPLIPTLQLSETVIQVFSCTITVQAHTSKLTEHQV